MSEEVGRERLVHEGMPDSHCNNDNNSHCDQFATYKTDDMSKSD